MGEHEPPGRGLNSEPAKTTEGESPDYALERAKEKAASIEDVLDITVNPDFMDKIFEDKSVARPLLNLLNAGRPKGDEFDFGSLDEAEKTRLVHTAGILVHNSLVTMRNNTLARIAEKESKADSSDVDSTSESQPQ